MAPHPSETGHHIGRGRHVMTQQGRDKEIAQHVPGGADGLAGVPRAFVGGAFPPAGKPLGVNGRQDARPGDLSAEAGFKGVSQRHIDVVQFDTFDLHAGIQSFSSR
jgi:hypothetical protein